MKFKISIFSASGAATFVPAMLWFRPAAELERNYTMRTRSWACNGAAIIATLSILAAPSPALTTQLGSPAQKVLGQPTYERQAQKNFPQSRAPLWAVLRTAKVSEDNKRGLFTAAFPLQVKALNGQMVTLSGFMLPLDTQTKAQHFLLSKYTPVCFFCPPGQPNEVVEVFVALGVPVTDRMLSVSGRFTLASESDKGLFFRLNQAVAR